MRPHILVVEDETIVAHDVRTTLTRRGYTVGVADSGRSCLSRAQRRKPDLVLMDIDLGKGMDGVETARRLRGTGVPVLFLTALSDSGTVARAMETHPLGYVIKPFDEPQLLASVEVALTRARDADAPPAEEAKALNRARMEVREEEVRRIARELHDEAGQLLSGLHFALEAVAQEAQPGTRVRLREVRGMVDQVQGELRRIAHEMRPSLLDDLGLMPALEFLAAGVSTRTDVQVRVSGSPGKRLPPLLETVLYRVAQEALTNVVRHSGASQARVHVSRGPQSIRCSIRDDGRGFDPDAVRAAGRGGLGLLGMRERVAAVNGTLRMQSEPGFGTEIVVAIPSKEALSRPVS